VQGEEVQGQEVQGTIATGRVTGGGAQVVGAVWTAIDIVPRRPDKLPVDRAAQLQAITPSRRFDSFGVPARAGVPGMVSSSKSL
jgi:hypothetical protein